MITGVIVDRREPEWVQKLVFGGAPVLVAILDYGDVWALGEDGCTLAIERKTPDDLLNTLKEERLFVQMARMAEARIETQIGGAQMMTTWPYLVIAGELQRFDDKVIADGRLTDWKYNALMGALLTVQEMGVFVTYCGKDDFEECVLRLGQRRRELEMKVLPARPPKIMGIEMQILASLPGIGLEKAQPILEKAGGLAWALDYLTDMQSSYKVDGIGSVTKERIRKAFGLDKGNKLAVIGTGENDEQE